jgi:hypothetical protein
VSFITVPDFHCISKDPRRIRGCFMTSLRPQSQTLATAGQPTTSASSKITYYSNVVLVKNELGRIQYGLKGLKSTSMVDELTLHAIFNFANGQQVTRCYGPDQKVLSLTYLSSYLVTTKGTKRDDLPTLPCPRRSVLR